MIVNKRLLVHILLVTSVIINEAFADIPNKNQLRELVKDYLIPDFQDGGLVLQDKTQFAVVILQPGNAWMKFLYDPSRDGYGQEPVINKCSSLSPPSNYKYSNYLAARPNNGVHSEIQILDRIDSLYKDYKAKHNNRPPKALLLYSWIVPCKTCTDKLVAKLTSKPFKSIPVKVVAYTTLGSCTRCECDVNYTRNKLKNTGIDLIYVRASEEELIKNLIAQLILE